mmetsp:Transcript_96320/g.297038  ORF Transcript_96320/g.297038 Transcript_96320/m.297038 type:complete len:308 (+) Transcript_96320:132-1055(+)
MRPGRAVTRTRSPALSRSRPSRRNSSGAVPSEPGCRQQGHVRLVGEVVLRQRHDVVAEVAREDVLLRDARDARSAAQAHDHLQLVLQHVHHAHDAAVAVGSQGVEHGAADATALRTERDGLENVGAPADTAIDEDGKVLLCGTRLLQRIHDLRQDLDSRPAGVELAATVVGEHAAGKAGLVGHDGVLPALDALQQHLHLGDGLEPGHVLPAEARVDVAADGAGRTLGAVNLAGVLVVALHVGALLRELVAHVLLTAAKLRRVHGYEERADTGLLQLLDVLLRAGTLGVDIQLREELLSRRARFQHLI